MKSWKWVKEVKNVCGGCDNVQWLKNMNICVGLKVRKWYKNGRGWKWVENGWNGCRLLKRSVKKMDLLGINDYISVSKWNRSKWLSVVGSWNHQNGKVQLAAFPKPTHPFKAVPALISLIPDPDICLLGYCHHCCHCHFHFHFHSCRGCHVVVAFDVSRRPEVVSMLDSEEDATISLIFAISLS